jgi:hypothetical protein
MPDTQQALFTIALPPARVARVIDTSPVVWSADVQAMFDVARYRLERNRALWFIGKPDGYSTSTKHGTCIVPKGNSTLCAKESYHICETLWRQVSAHVAKRCLPGTANTLSASDAATKPVNDQCLCLRCLKRDLTELVALRQDRTEVLHFSSDEELSTAEQD